MNKKHLLNSSLSIFKKAYLCLFLTSSFLYGAAQTIPISSVRVEEATRDLQLLEKIPSNYSFNNRPFVCSKAIPLDSIYRWIDSAYFDKTQLNGQLLNNKWANIRILPVALLQQFNSTTPYGYNNGGFLKARGFQQLTSLGVFARFGPLQIQLQPELIWSQNNAYPITPQFGSITTPNRKQVLPGQSNISLNVNALSVGIASVNKWYGPGINNSLLMSNNAAGFLRAYIGTNRPLVTPIGSLEFTLSSGWLNEDSTTAFENYAMQPTSKLNRTMYYNGLVISFQPKWLKGFHAGMSRAYAVSDMNSAVYNNSSFVDHYLPIFSVIEKKSILANEDQKERDQQVSLFLRCVLPKDHFEWYLEYGWNDHSVDTRDLFMGPGHSAAYLVGFKKIVPLPAQKAYVNFEVEYMRGEQLAENLVRDAGNWNWHGALQSFTHNNQLLGSAVGPGSNTFKILSSYNKGWKRYLFSIENISNDPQYHVNSPWTDKVFGTGVDISFKHFIISSQLKTVVQKNYGWELNNNITNIFICLGINYLF